MAIGRAGRFAAVAWTAAAAVLSAAEVVTIGPLYDGGVVNLTPGDELVVRLPADPQSGEAWELAMNDPAILRSQAEAAGEKAAGGDFATRVFRFKAVATGSSSVGVACLRPADPAAPPRRLFRVLAVVKSAAPRRALILEEPDNGSQIFLTQGERVSVRLPSSPATGFGWTVARNAPSVLQPVGDPRFEPPGKAIPGAGGYQVFEFRVVAGGASALSLVYRRPFEKDQPPARTWSIFLSCAAAAPAS